MQTDDGAMLRDDAGATQTDDGATQTDDGATQTDVGVWLGHKRLHCYVLPSSTFYSTHVMQHPSCAAERR